MWTPKRILILLGGAAFFATIFAIYLFFLGGFDGLPLLPSQYRAGPAGDEPPPPPPGDSDLKLLEAFGPECPELRQPIRLYLRSKGLAVAAGEFSIEPDGRVKLAPFSACLFPKGKGDAKNQEINTVRCDVAFLTMDEKVKNAADMGRRKIVGVELRAKQVEDDPASPPRGILITNNRRTAQKTDDIEVRITNAPLFYDDARNLIWTEGIVQLLDTQTQPQPTRVTAKGMELQLTRNTNPTRAKTKSPAGKDKGEGVNGVESLTLHADVSMHLYVDPQSGFLAGTQAPKDRPAKLAVKSIEPQEKSQVIIQTLGPFHYDLVGDIARFHSPQAAGAARSSDLVRVTRKHLVAGKPPQHDQLECDQLELQFRRKADAVAKAPTSDSNRNADKEIETALATTRPGQRVELTMQTENLKAYGSELLYRCASPTSGPQTMLKGQPMIAFKDGHRIQARELHLVGADKKGDGQKAAARGPGQIDLYDKTKDPKKGQNEYPLHAVWRDMLVSHKVNEDGKILDLLILTGDASFIDEDHKQELNGQKLQVWLDSDSKPQATDVNGKTLVGRQRPRRLEGFDKVSAFSPEMIVRHTNHLVVRFKDDVVTDMPLLDTLPPAQPVGLPGPSPVAAAPAKPAPAPPSAQPATPGAAPGPAAKKDRKPIELQADDVTAFVSRAGSKNHLREVVTSGNVHVVQDAQNPKEKGLDIDGENLHLLHHQTGDILYIHGDSRKPAKLQMGEMTMLGPKVTINQKENTAEVEGTGAMHLPSNTKLDGGKTTKPGTKVVIHWNERMLFNGKFAEFLGGVVAYQDGGSLKCQTLGVTLDKEVSFKEGQRGGHGAKVEKMVCSGKVYVLDEIKDQTGKLVTRRDGAFTELTVDNLDGPTIGTGPGFVASWGKGGTEITAGAPAPVKSDATPAGKGEMMLTRIEFEGRMFTNAKDNTRTSKFYDSVEVFHLPAKEPNVAFNRNTPPKNGFYIKCELLSVYTKQIDGKQSQVMWGERKVVFRTDQFFGRADIVKFDEAADTVIFEANTGGTVTIDKIAAPGAQNQVIRGKKILYKRTTGEFLLDGVQSIQS